MQFGGAAEIVQGKEIEGPVLGYELDIVVVVRMADRLYDRGPGGVDVRAQRWFVLFEKLAKLVGSDGYILLMSAVSNRTVWCGRGGSVILLPA